MSFFFLLDNLGTVSVKHFRTQITQFSFKYGTDSHYTTISCGFVERWKLSVLLRVTKRGKTVFFFLFCVFFCEFPVRSACRCLREAHVTHRLCAVVMPFGDGHDAVMNHRQLTTQYRVGHVRSRS